nr:S-adenosyl-l-methionine hydroxide adenosyltransferase family protein [Parasphaerochaeta coccoides]
MNRTLVFQTDFGRTDGAVAAMYGVALDINPELKIFDLSHEVPPYHIFEASYNLVQTLSYWAEGTVFISVVDPGVGTDRKSIVVRTRSGHFVVTPDNGTLTHIAKDVGIEEAREIEESLHRRPGSSESYTFHGRDLYAVTGAKLAAGLIPFDAVGPVLPLSSLVILPTTQTEILPDEVKGSIDVLDARFGSLWTSVEREAFLTLGLKFGDLVDVSITGQGTPMYRSTIVYCHSFGDVPAGHPLVYVNSLYRMGVAINQGSFAKAYNIGTGQGWKVSFRRAGDDRK